MPRVNQLMSRKICKKCGKDLLTRITIVPYDGWTAVMYSRVCKTHGIITSILEEI